MRYGLEFGLDARKGVLVGMQDMLLRLMHAAFQGLH